MEQDGTWAGPGGDRYRREGDEIVKVGASPSTPSLFRPSGSVKIGRRPDGVGYRPSWALRHRGRQAVLFDLQGRQVAGWAASKGARCPDPYCPEGALQRLVQSRNETWETQLRSDHPG